MDTDQLRETRDVMKNKADIVSNLACEGETLFKRSKSDTVPFIRNSRYSQRKEADRLLNNFDKHPHPKM